MRHDAHDMTEAAKNAPNWALRKWLAAAGVTLCFGALVINGSLRDDAAKAAESRALAEAELDQLTAGFDTFATSARDDIVAVSLNNHKPAEDLASFDFTKIEIAEIKADEKNCLAEALYFEARAEPLIGQMAVADVVLNRVKSPLYPDSICGVVRQGASRKTGCQFSYNCDGSLNRTRNKIAWSNAEDLAGAILAGVHIPVSRNATHYHADYVSPYWAPNLTPTAEIGAHRFYRSPDRSITTAAQ